MLSKSLWSNELTWGHGSAVTINMEHSIIYCWGTQDFQHWTELRWVYHPSDKINGTQVDTQRNNFIIMSKGNHIVLMSLWHYYHDDVIKWKHFPRNWPFVREIHRSPVNFPHKGQWPGALMFSLIYVWINDWVNNREAGDLRRQHGHYDVIVMVMYPLGLG